MKVLETHQTGLTTTCFTPSNQHAIAQIVLDSKADLHALTITVSSYVAFSNLSVGIIFAGFPELGFNINSHYPTIKMPPISDRKLLLHLLRMISTELEEVAEIISYLVGKWDITLEADYSPTFSIENYNIPSKKLHKREDQIFQYNNRDKASIVSKVVINIHATTEDSKYPLYQISVLTHNVTNYDRVHFALCRENFLWFFDETKKPGEMRDNKVMVYLVEKPDIIRFLEIVASIDPTVLFLAKRFAYVQYIKYEPTLSGVESVAEVQSMTVDAPLPARPPVSAQRSA